MTFHFSLIALCAFGLFVPDPSHAQRLISAPVVSSHRLDPNDGTRPIHERVGDSLVARPGVYDVTAMVREWVDCTHPNHGLLLHADQFTDGHNGDWGIKQ